LIFDQEVKWMENTDKAKRTRKMKENWFLFAMVLTEPLGDL